MRHYMANNRLGADAAADQQRAARASSSDGWRPRPRQLVLRQRYVELKIAYWQAVQSGRRRPAPSRSPTRRAALADELRAVTHDPSTDRRPGSGTPPHRERNDFPMRVNAYAAPVRRRAAGPHHHRAPRARRPTTCCIDIKFSGICHSDIHTVRGDWGQQPLPARAGPRDRRHRRRGRRRGDPARASATASASAAWSTRAASARTAARRRAVLPRRQHRDLRPPPTATAPPPTAATPRTSSSTRTSC